MPASDPVDSDDEFDDAFPRDAVKVGRLSHGPRQSEFG